MTDKWSWRENGLEKWEQKDRENTVQPNLSLGFSNTFCNTCQPIPAAPLLCSLFCLFIPLSLLLAISFPCSAPHPYRWVRRKWSTEDKCFSPTLGESAWYSPSLLSWGYQSETHVFIFRGCSSILLLSLTDSSYGWSKRVPFSKAGDCRQPGKGGWRASPQGRAGGREQMEEGKPHKHAKRVQQVHCCQMIVYHLFIHLKPKLGDRSTIPCHNQSP